ncbi:mechanosensitive ion channel domain-containing protein [Glaciecola sp. 1036]|uniref:mechanosensitive ion channel domain-containing protein n=1 Tax=Alteromonadaceae TaxID=72275 RepID=UPI003CFEF545
MDTVFSQMIALGISLIPFILTILMAIALLAISHKVLLGDKHLSMSARFPRQIILSLLYVIALVAVVISLPIEKDTRNQVLGLLGILLSGVIAFSSTTLVSNVMAGLVLRITKPFRTGDFIRVGSFFGRVTEKGIFDTELQTEQRELIAFTNSYLLSEPIQVVRSSGTIISANLSLGYDIHHKKIEELLVIAATEAGLSEPFVQIIELGDFSISYRVSGLLSEIKSLISARSKLHANILDTLHGADIEIVSPGFMNQRPIGDNPPVIAKPPRKKVTEEETATPESIVFDKAEAAEQHEFKETELREQIKALELRVKEAADAEEKEKLNKQLGIKQARLNKLLETKKANEA